MNTTSSLALLNYSDLSAKEQLIFELMEKLENSVRRLDEVEKRATMHGDTAFTIFSAALVFFMTPGLGYFYSGMARSKSALSLILICYLSMAVVLVQVKYNMQCCVLTKGPCNKWTLFGASLAFSEYGNAFMGDFYYGGARRVGSNDLRASVSSVAFFLYQGMFATITPALIFGSVAERVKVLPSLVFMFVWTSLVYDPLAYWTWASNGWLNKMESLDYAGGTPVHIGSGFAGLAMAIVLGKRQGYKKKVESDEWKAHNINSVFLGTAMLWFGWFGFNGGSALSGSSRAAMAAAVTSISAAAGGLTWVLFDYRHDKKLSGLAFCCGAVAGLVGVTPGSGFVAPWSALVIGFSSSVMCNFGCRIKHYFGYDDTLDVFGTHGFGGFFGNIMTGIFAEKWIAQLDGQIIKGGWLDGHWMQVPLQMAGSFAGAAYSFCMTFVILMILQRLPYLSLRLKPEDEYTGIDCVQMGETITSFFVADSSAYSKENDINGSLPVSRRKLSLFSVLTNRRLDLMNSITKTDSENRNVY